MFLKFVRPTFRLAKLFRSTFAQRVWTSSALARAPMPVLKFSHTTGSQPLKYSAVGFIGTLWSWLGFEEYKEEDPLILTIKRGILAMQREEYDKAEYLLHLALKMAQDVMHEKAQTYIFAVMADNDFQKKNYDKAEILYKTVMSRLLSSGLPQNDEAIVEMSLKLARIYSETGKQHLADEGFGFVLKHQKDRINGINMDAEELNDSERNSLALWGLILDWYSQHLSKKRMMKNALANLKEAHLISEKLDGPKAGRTLRLLSDLGTMSNEMHHFEEAVKYFKRAIQIGREIGTDDLPVFQYNLGITYLQMMEIKLAKQWCTKAFKLARSQDNPTVEEKADECLKKARSLEKT